MEVSDWILLITAAIVAWYTWETRRLRLTAETQLNQQVKQTSAALEQIETSIRPFVIFSPPERGTGLVVVENIGVGVALNVRMPDVIIHNGSEDSYPVSLHFPDRIPVLRPGVKVEMKVESRLGGEPFRDFFSAHIDPRYATQALKVVVEYENIQLRTYAVEQSVEPRSLSITEFRAISSGSSASREA